VLEEVDRAARLAEVVVPARADGDPLPVDGDGVGEAVVRGSVGSDELRLLEPVAVLPPEDVGRARARAARAFPGSSDDAARAVDGEGHPEVDPAAAVGGGDDVDLLEGLPGGAERGDRPGVAADEVVVGRAGEEPATRGGDRVAEPVAVLRVPPAERDALELERLLPRVLRGRRAGERRREGRGQRGEGEGSEGGHFSLLSFETPGPAHRWFTPFPASTRIR